MSELVRNSYYTKSGGEFSENILMVRTLIEVVGEGFGAKNVMVDRILNKIDLSKCGDTQLSKKEHDENGEELIAIDFNEKEIECLNRVMMSRKTDYKKAHNYFYNILEVFTWGAFETYFCSIWDEILRKKPEMLNSNKNSLSFSEIIERKDDIMNLLIEKELGKIEHFKLKDIEKYLDEKAGIVINKEDYDKLEQAYLARNIIAHSTGIVKREYVDKI